MYLLLEHGHLVREESHDVVFAERLGQEETESGAHRGEDTGEEKTIARPKQGPGQYVLGGGRESRVNIGAWCTRCSC